MPRASVACVHGREGPESMMMGTGDRMLIHPGSGHLHLLNPKQSTTERETDQQKMQHNLDDINSQASSREAGLQLIIQQLRSHLEKANVSGLILRVLSLSPCVCVRVNAYK